MIDDKDIKIEDIVLHKGMEGLRCQVCKQQITVIRRVSDAKNPQRKNLWALPCSHLITPVAEDAIVKDMLKRGL